MAKHETAEDIERRHAAIEAMTIEAGLIEAPAGYDPEVAALAAGYTRQEIIDIVRECKEDDEDDDID